MIILLILLIIGIAFWFFVISYTVGREVSLKRNSFICFEERGGTSLVMVKNGKVGRVVQADNGKRIVLTEKLYKIRKGWDEIYLYKYRILLQGNQKKKIQKKSRLNRLFLSFIPFLLICIAACSGGDTEVEVTQKPEPVEEVIPEPTPEPEPEPEPVVETVYVPTLESWGAEDGLIDVAKDNNGNCVDPLLTNKAEFPNDFSREKITTSQPAKGGPECLDDDHEGSQRETEFGTESTGRGNFYDNLFKKSTFYLDNRGRVKNTRIARSFIMGSPSANSNGSWGKLYGRYNPDSQEYMDRKALWEACGVGTDPQIGSEKEDGRTDNGINGEWQETRTVTMNRGSEETRVEICLRLDTLPGAVKCLVTGPEEKVVLHTFDGEEELDVEIREKGHHKLCALFDEG